MNADSVYETERFRLRPLRAGDATPRYVSWWNDAEIQAGLNSAPRGWDGARARRHIEGFDNRTRFHFGIFPRTEAEPIGFYAVFLTPATRIARSNIVIGQKAWWGQGVVAEVRGRMLEVLFEDLGFEKIKGEIYGRNPASIFNYKAQGFTCEGILRSEIPGYRGGRADVFVFGLLREEWRARRAT